jgi:serine/threonine protein kinase
MDQYIGRQLGNYRIIRRLGAGGFATVYLGRHVQTNWDAAVKILNINYPEETFRQEADMLWNLRHPHIVGIKEFNIENGTYYLIMEYAAKGSLRHTRPQGDILPQPLILTYVKQIASALDYIHKNRLVHCDIKPPNFLVRDNGEVLLSDFGIATEAVSMSLRHMSLPAPREPVLGTPHYITPEQLLGQKLTPATDQYALGIVVYEWLCGNPPFTGPDPYLICQAHIHTLPPRFNDPTISAQLEGVVRRTLAKDPKDRFPAILDFAQALEDAIQNRQMLAPQPQQHQDIFQPAMGGAIWSQLPSPAGGHNDSTEPVPPQSPGNSIYTPLPRPKKAPIKRKPRRPPRFDWANLLEEARDRRFLFIGISFDLLCVIPLFLWLRDPSFAFDLSFLNGLADLPYLDWVSNLLHPSLTIDQSYLNIYLNWVIGLPILAIISRILCTATITHRIALPLAWILTAYETLCTFGLVVYFTKDFATSLPVLLPIATVLAWFMNNFLYARKK